MTTPQDPNQSQGWGQQQPGPGAQPPHGQSPQGQPPQGQPPQGQSPQGQPPQGQPPQGQPPQGQSPQGQSPQGQSPQGQPPQGQPPQGQPPQGQPPQGQPWGDPQQPGQPGQPGQPVQPGQPWAGASAQGQVEQPKKASWKKRLPAVIAVLVVAVLFALFRNGLFASDPEVGDCITADGSSYETVDCDSDEAQYRVIGTDDDMTQSEFYADPDTCAEVAAESDAASGVALWSGRDADEDGSVYCAEAL